MADPWTCGKCRTENTGRTCPTCTDRRVNAEIANNIRWSRETDRSLATAPARAKGPGAIEYWLTKVDPDGEMTYADRLKAAGNAKRAYYARLGKAGRRAKQLRAAG